MGVVYLARQERLGARTVAIKVLPNHIAGSLSARARFKAEVLSVARQRHSGVVGVHDFIESDALLALVMEWVDGASLQQLVGRLVAMNAYRPKPSPAQISAAIDQVSVPDPTFDHFVARLGGGVAAALEEVHRTGILHRDVSPSNILLRRDGHPLISDFGLAKAEHSAGMTVVPGFLGTLAYASPEQLAGSPIDARGDVYSLGCTLLHVATGSLPHQETSPVGAIEAVRRGEPLRRLKDARAIDPMLRAIIARACAVSRSSPHHENPASETPAATSNP
jgi:eukaryotic-like serine/threonine-protein kinase